MKLIKILPNDRFSIGPLRGNYDQYVNKEGFLLYNDTGKADWIVQDVQPTDANGDPEKDSDGNVLPKVPTHAKELGATNIIQSLPKLSGVELPKKHWRLTVDGNGLRAKSKDQRIAVDKAEADAQEARERKQVVEQEIAKEIAGVRKQERNDAAGRAKANGKITQAELEAVEAEG